MSDSAIENQKAIQKPATLKPGTMAAASSINSAFITSENNPSVSTVSGKATSLTTGLINTFITPSTIESITALMSVIVVPGIRYVATMIAAVETNRCMSIFIVSV